MGFIGLQGLSYSQTIQLICQGDPNCSPPPLRFVHASVCLQSRQSSIWGFQRSALPLGTRQSLIFTVTCVIFHFSFSGPKQSYFTRHTRCFNVKIKHRVKQQSLCSYVHSSIFDVMPRWQLWRWTNIRSDFGSYTTHVVCSPKDSDLHNRFHKHLFKCSDLLPQLHHSPEGIHPPPTHTHKHTQTHTHTLWFLLIVSSVKEDLEGACVRKPEHKVLMKTRISLVRWSHVKDTLTRLLGELMIYACLYTGRKYRPILKALTCK